MYHLIRFIKYLFTFAPCVIYFNFIKCSVANSFRNPLQKTNISHRTMRSKNKTYLEYWQFLQITQWCVNH